MYLYIIINHLNIFNMNEEAIFFIGNLLQNEFIKKIKFSKKYFKVKFKGDKIFTPYDYSRHDIQTLLTDLEELENSKK